jgi:hypothetical protein
MKRWKERDTDACPRCGQIEDAPHVWKCIGEGASDVWDRSLTDLEEWLNSVNTDPDITTSILWNLNKWRDPISAGAPPTILDDIAEQQDDIGWLNFFEGKLAMAWEETQQQYYILIKSRRTGKRWAISLIKKLWQIAWDLWDHRNGILHKHSNPISLEDNERMDQKI